MSVSFDALAARATADPFFLGWALTAYQRRHNLDDAALLGCAPDALTMRRLCRRLGAAAPARTAADDVAAIAGRFQIDAAALGRIVEGAPPAAANGQTPPNTG
jgi:hypothetical protein